MEAAAPEISVIVLTFNQERSIARTLDSILSQRCDVAFEVIIGEDGSSDGTRAICERYRDAYPDKVKLMPMAANKGVVRNYFDCLNAASGRYIADCAGDDYWTSNDKLSRQYELLNTNASVSVVHTGWNDCIRDYHPITPGRKMLEMLLWHADGISVHLCTAMYRARLVKDALRRDADMVCNELFGCEDLPVLAVLLANGDVAYMPESTLCYETERDGISHNSDLRRSAVFACQAVYATKKLCICYDVDFAKARRYVDKSLTYAMSHAFQLHDGDLGTRVAMLSRHVGVPLTLKARIYRALMSNDLLWRMAVTIRKMLIG